MNTETDDNNTNSASIAFGSMGTNRNAFSYGHPYAESILEEAKKILRESETGAHLLKVQSTHSVPIQVMKGNGASGFNAQAGVIYLQVPSKTNTAKPELILELAKSLREADQQLFGYVAPDPTIDIIEYAAVMHAKALDSVLYICKVVKELTNSSHFSVLLDAIEKLGHIRLYRAYSEDATEQELYDIYAGK